MADRNVTVDIIGRDRASRAFDSAGKSADKAGANFGKLAKGLGVLSAHSAAAGTAALDAVLAIGKAGQVATAAAPAVAGLAASMASLGAAAGLAFGTFKLASPGVVKALEPATKAVLGMHTALGKLASAGVRPLAQQFVKLNLPAIEKGMGRIATVANRVLRALGGWLNSGAGRNATANVVNATASAFERLAPKVAGLGVAVLQMTGRTAGASLQGFSDLLGRILDRFTAFINTIDASNVQAGFKLIGVVFRDVGMALHLIGDGLAWIQAHQDSMKRLSDGLAVVAVVAGVLTGTWIPALIGGLHLLAGHWDAVSAAVQVAWGWIQNLKVGWDSLVANLRAGASSAFDIVTKALRDNQGVISKTIGYLNAMMIIIGGIARIGLPALAQGFHVIVAVLNHVVLPAMRFFLITTLQALQGILGGFAAAFGWLPEIGPKLRTAAANFKSFAGSVDSALGSIHDRVVTVAIHAQPTGMWASGHGANIAQNVLSAAQKGAKAASTSIALPKITGGGFGGSLGTGGGGSSSGLINMMIHIGAASGKAIAFGIKSTTQTVVDAVKQLAQKAQDAYKKATEKLTALVKARGTLAQNIAQGITATGGVLGQTANGVFTGKSITGRLQQAVTNAKNFIVVLKALKARGLGNGLLMQLANAGPEEGLAAGRAILEAGNIGQLNLLQAQLGSLGKQAGAFVGGAVYNSAIAAQQGRVDAARAQLFTAYNTNTTVNIHLAAGFVGSPQQLAHALQQIIKQAQARGHSIKFT